MLYVCSGSTWYCLFALVFVFFVGRPLPRTPLSSSSAASDVYQRQGAWRWVVAGCRWVVSGCGLFVKGCKCVVGGWRRVVGGGGWS